MVRARRILAGLAAAAGLAGCGPTMHPITREAGEIGAQPECCASFRDMPYVTLPAAQKRLFRIDPLSPVHAFKDGRSRFVAVRLPAGASTLRVRSNVVTAWVEPTTFDPSITFLDERFVVVGEPALAMRLATDGGDHYAQAEVRVPARATYAILYTRPSVYLTKRREGPLPLVVGAQSMSIPMAAFPVMAGPRGELVLEATGR